MTAADSFESVIDDAWLTPCDYSRKRGAGPVNAIRCLGCMFSGPGSCDEKMQRDLVRRCKHVAARIGSEHGDNAGGSVNIGEVATFPGVKADKAQALKVLEEAAEVFGAWQEFEVNQGKEVFAFLPLLEERADVIQAVSNLVAAFGVTDFASYMEEFRALNEERGRL